MISWQTRGQRQRDKLCAHAIEKDVFNKARFLVLKL